MQPLDNYEQELRDWDDHEAEVASLLAEYLADTYQPDTVVDIGCGSGTYLTFFEDMGVGVLGIDGESTGGFVLKPENFIQHDLRKKLILDEKYDMAICLEVIEHLQPEYEDVMMDSICDASDLIIFSAAKEGQVGTNHYNCQNKPHWLAHFLARGFAQDEEETDKLLLYMNSLEAFQKTPWLIENIMVIKRI